MATPLTDGDGRLDQSVAEELVAKVRAEAANSSTGLVLTRRCSHVGTSLQREEARRTGVYLLQGGDQEALGETHCYIGEADIAAVGVVSRCGRRP